MLAFFKTCILCLVARNKSYELGQLSRSFDALESEDSNSSSSRGKDPSPRLIAASSKNAINNASSSKPAGSHASCTSTSAILGSNNPSTIRAAGARSRVAGGRLRSRTVEVETGTHHVLGVGHGQRAPLGTVSTNQNVNPDTMTLGRGRKSDLVGFGGGNDSSGLASSGESDRDKWSVTPDGYYTLSKVS